MRSTALSRAVHCLLAAATPVLPPARTTLALAAIWGADIAGTFLLTDRAQIVLNGMAIAATFALLGRWIERRANTRAQKFIFEADKERAALIKTIERLTGGAQTGPIRLRDVA